MIRKRVVPLLVDCLAIGVLGLACVTSEPGTGTESVR